MPYRDQIIHLTLIVLITITIRVKKNYLTGLMHVKGDIHQRGKKEKALDCMHSDLLDFFAKEPSCGLARPKTQISTFVFVIILPIPI